jgi:hypothetical protein
MAFDPDALPIPDLGLRCPGCGYNLAGLPEHRCPECGRALDFDDHIPKGDFPPVIFQGKEVRITPEVSEILNRARIPFMEKIGPVESLYGIGGPTNTRARLAVPRGRYLEVIHLLRQYEVHGELPPEPGPPAPDWTCPACGETNPGAFETCWSCSQEPPDAS